MAMLPDHAFTARLDLAAILFFPQERDMPHGVFGDRDAGPQGAGICRPAACGLFGRRGDQPALRPANPRADPARDTERKGRA